MIPACHRYRSWRNCRDASNCWSRSFWPTRRSTWHWRSKSPSTNAQPPRTLIQKGRAGFTSVGWSVQGELLREGFCWGCWPSAWRATALGPAKTLSLLNWCHPCSKCEIPVLCTVLWGEPAQMECPKWTLSAGGDIATALHFAGCHDNWSWDPEEHKETAEMLICYAQRTLSSPDPPRPALSFKPISFLPLFLLPNSFLSHFFPIHRQYPRDSRQERITVRLVNVGVRDPRILIKAKC